MGDFPGSSVAKTRGTWVPSLVGELRSQILCSVAKKEEGGEEKKSQKEREEEKKGGRESEGSSDEGKG